MDRAIKFRFWRDNKMQIAHTMNAYDDNNFAGEGETLMQFTGLLDCEGKEVFEGDILEVTSNNDGQKYITTFKVNLINGLYIDNLSLCMDMCLYDYGITSSNCKVIGNLYEHPNLLNNE